MAGLCIIGGGAMGSAFAKGVISSGAMKPDEVVIADMDQARLGKLAAEIGVKVTADNTEAARGAGVILLAVKPPIVPDVAAQLASVITKDQLVVSIAAGVSLAAIEGRLPEGVGVIRATISIASF